MTIRLLYIVATILGAITHVGYFNRFETHLHGLKILQAFALSIMLSTVILFSSGSVSSYWTAFTYVFIVAGFYFIGLYSSLLIYRLYLSPIRNFPGPFFARISSLYRTSQVAGIANGHKLSYKLHRKYGDFVRIGSNELSITHPDAVQAIYGTTTRCTKGTYYDIDWPLNSLLMTRSRESHDHRRRLWVQAFSDRALRGYQHRIDAYSDDLVRLIATFEGQSQGVNVSKFFEFFSFDVMSDLAFGKACGMLKSGEEHRALKLMAEGLDPLHLLMPTWLFRIVSATPGVNASYWEFVTYCSEEMDKRMKMKVDVPDIVSALLQPFETKIPSNEELKLLYGDSRLIIVAGSDTTASTLTHLFYLLARNITEAQKLREEVRPFVADDGSVNSVELQKLDHLNGCINETFRLYPPVPAALQRLTPPEGLTIGSTYIPGNMTVWCPQYVLGRKEEIYPEASVFLPERWYSRPDMVKNKGSFIPFSTGVYNCIGKSLALSEIRTVVAKLITAYDISFAAGDDGTNLLEKSRDRFSLESADLNLCFEPRGKRM